MEEVPKVMILGEEDSPQIRARTQNKCTMCVLCRREPDFAEEISNKQIRAAVEIPEGFDAKLASGASNDRKNLHV